ncbi:heme-binding protein [Nonomuraea phyllanthi]|uniref:Heme-binding protein n=1 Tax=Nonomuraea phyllanthi TaxID=2219224 RepID=A0A5C4WDY0_9ACTN|nr:heme-binding protein [Nonomuraea phyllanthi]KAB8193148.1 heme-binding protein [Nonomuraea phyllanthi]QFY10990.1 heme-binding protein [Nonomuraea phyllanthi]
MNLELALRMTEAAVRQAVREGVPISVAVLDEGGHLVSFQRMEGAGIAGPGLAQGKAYTAVALRASTAELAPRTAPGGDLHGLPRDGLVCVGGGIPLWADYGEGWRVVGGIGVSGGTTTQDVECAEAAAEVWRTR